MADNRQVYFVNHNTRTTQWEDPRMRSDDGKIRQQASSQPQHTSTESAECTPLSPTTGAQAQNILTSLIEAEKEKKSLHHNTVSKEFAQLCENRRRMIVEREVGRLREATTQIDGVMSSLNLPAALEVSSSIGDELPPSILKKSKAIIKNGGIQAIYVLFCQLPECLQRNEQILNEIRQMLNEEQATDDELRAKFGAKWNRAPSSELVAPLRQEVNKYDEILQQAGNADGMVRAKFVTHREGIEMLCMPVDLLKMAILLAGNPIVSELRPFYLQAETLKAEQKATVEEIKGLEFHMRKEFVQALMVNEKLISVEQLDQEIDRVFQPFVNKVTDSLQRQKFLLANTKGVSEQLTLLKSKGIDRSIHDKVLKKIEDAHDGYMVLIAHLQEGKRFYGDLTELLKKLQNKCSDLVSAREAEKKEMIKILAMQLHLKRLELPIHIEETSIQRPNP